VARLARKAVTLGRDDPVALSLGGHALLNVDLAEGIAYIDRGLALNPSLARAWHASGWARIWSGEPEQAFEHFARAMRLSPLDPFIHSMQNGTAFALFFMDRYDEASASAEMALRGRRDYSGALIMCAASDALGGRLSEARDAAARYLKLDVGRRVSNARELALFRDRLMLPSSKRPCAWPASRSSDDWGHRLKTDRLDRVGLARPLRGRSQTRQSRPSLPSFLVGVAAGDRNEQ